MKKTSFTTYLLLAAVLNSYALPALAEDDISGPVEGGHLEESAPQARALLSHSQRDQLLEQLGGMKEKLANARVLLDKGEAELKARKGERNHMALVAAGSLIATVALGVGTVKAGIAAQGPSFRMEYDMLTGLSAIGTGTAGLSTVMSAGSAISSMSDVKLAREKVAKLDQAVKALEYRVNRLSGVVYPDRSAE